MKKALLFALFSLSLTAVAQVQLPMEYSIQKPLQLHTVNTGSKSDSVLVRGYDKIVKYVPRSEFSAGGSQDLQQTLIKGSSANISTGLNITSPSVMLGTNNGRGSITMDATSFALNSQGVPFNIISPSLYFLSGIVNFNNGAVKFNTSSQFYNNINILNGRSLLFETSTGQITGIIGKLGNNSLNIQSNDGIQLSSSVVKKGDNNVAVSLGGNFAGINGDINLVSETSPISSTDAGKIGEIKITTDYIYVCTAANTWVRSPLTTW